MDNTPSAELPAPAKESIPIAWRLTAVVGLITGALWALLILFAPQTIKLLAGIAPVVGGIYVGRKVKGRTFVHGILLALFGVVAAVAIVTPVVYAVDPTTLQALFPTDPNQPAIQMTPEAALVTIAFSGLIMLVPFPIYGVMLSVRNARREQDFRKETDRRGGQLQRPGAVRTVDDLLDLQLPKLASWVAQVFKRNGFAMEDYKFGKDVVDLYLKRENPEEKWIVRCTTEEIKPGMALSLDQELRDSEWVKGVIASSAKISEATRKTLRRNQRIEALDGETLMDMAA